MSKKLSVLLAAFFLFILPRLHAAVTGTVINRDGVVVANAKVSAYRLETREELTSRLLSADPARTPIAAVTVNSNGSFSLDLKGETIVEIAAEAGGYSPLSLRATANEELGTIALASAGLKRGRVTAGGKGVANATVAWTGGGTFVTRTDSEGYYTVPDPEKWASILVVIHPDFAILGTQPRPNANKSVDVVLEKGTLISGKAFRPDGSPAGGAKILVDGWMLGRTTEDGSFTLPHVSRGWTEIWIVANDQIAVVTSAGFKPGAINARLAKASSLSGVVRDAKTQKPLARAMVNLSRAAAGGSLNPVLDTAVSSNDGSYRMTLPSGSFELSPIVPAYSFDRPEVSLKAGQSLVRALSGTLGGSAAGFVYDENKKPVAGAVVLSTSSERMRPTWRSFASTENETRVTGPDGRFILRSVTPDLELKVEARKKGFPAGQSPSFRVASGERKGGLAITIPQGITITGKVTDREGNPLGGVAVAATENDGDPRGGMMRRMIILAGEMPGEDVLTTGKDGTFALRLKEGRYDLGFRRSGFAPKNVRAIEVKRGAEPLSVKLDPGADITGRVTRNGSGFEGATVVAFSEMNRAQTVTAADGSFALVDLSPGPLSLTVVKPGEFMGDNRQATAPAKDLVIEIPAGGRIVGRVIEKESGAPVTDFSAGISNTRSGGGIVTMGPPSMRNFHSDDGTFVLENVSPDLPLQVMVNAPGFAPFKQSGIRVEAGKSSEEIVAALESGATLSGRVTSPEGSPVAGVSVAPESDSPERMFISGMPRAGAVATDAAGEYTLESLSAGETTFSFSKEGFETKKQTVKLEPRTNRLDVRLSRGATLSGTVVSDSGAPVAEARVFASAGLENARATTDANGGFRMEGLAAGRYEVSASKRGWIAAEMKDVDVAAAGPLRLVLRSGGRISGHVSGLTESELAVSSVVARSAAGQNVGAVASNGEYLIEGVPAGTVTVKAEAGAFRNTRSSSEKTVEMPDGGSLQVDLEFRNDTVISGVVTRDGKPDANAAVYFDPLDATVQTRANVNTDANGGYEVRGLDPGNYLVNVISFRKMASYAKKYTVAGSGRFDIDIRGAAVSGSIVDAATSEPLNEAVVTIGTADEELGPVAGRRGITDNAGHFSIDAVEPGQYRGRAEKKGYGQQVLDIAVTESGASDVQFKLAKQDGVRVRIVDARDNHVLQGAIVAYDGTGRLATQAFDAADSNGVTTLNLGPGTYRLRVGSFGETYADRFLTVTVPSPQITVGLTPGGTLVTSSSNTQPIACKLISAAGDNVGSVFNEIGDVVRPGETRFPNLAPGSYQLVLLDASRNPSRTIPFEIGEGRATTVEVK